MKTPTVTLIIGFVVTSTGVTQPLSVRDDLIFPVNPPKKGSPEQPSKVTIRRLQHPFPLSKPDPAGRQFLESIKVWNAAQALIRNGKEAEASAIMKNAKERLEAIQKNYPDFAPFPVQQLASTIDEAIALNTTNKNPAEQGAAANP